MKIYQKLARVLQHFSLPSKGRAGERSSRSKGRAGERSSRSKGRAGERSSRSRGRAGERSYRTKGRAGERSYRSWTLFLLVLQISVSSCKKNDEPAPADPSGNITFSIDHQVNGQPLKQNELIYTNAAGNNYLVTDLMYFISDITFYHNKGTPVVIGEWKDVFYIDENMPETKTIRFPDKIPAGTYDSITFIFGIPEAKNISFIYVNPPEALMAWPAVLGGGYHYMMMNGKWKDPSGNLMPFNFHLGIGQLYKGNTYNVDSIYAFVQNYFTIRLPGSSFQLADKENLTLHLTMNIAQWFENPHVYDYNYWGGAIMQNQAAMQMVKENGWDVFSIGKH